MSGSSDNQLLMYFQQTATSDALTGESTADLAGDDHLMEGFSPGKFFEAEDFSFAMKLYDDGGRGEGGEARPFARWRALKTAADEDDQLYWAEADEVTINRMIDSSTPKLLEHCLTGKPFETAVLVKRARLHTTGNMAVVLRMEFTKVVILAIDWQHGDCLMETCKFKFLTVKPTYVKRSVDGSTFTDLGCSWNAEWKPKPKVSGNG